MNKTHVPKECWMETLTRLYSPSALRQLKKKVERLQNPKIRFKDKFLELLEHTRRGRPQEQKVGA